MRRIKPFNLKQIQKNYVAGFLQDDIRKKVQRESWVDYSKTPNAPLKKMKLKRDKKNLIWWWNFSRTLVKESASQLMP